MIRRVNSDIGLLLIMISKTIAIIGLSGSKQRNQTVLRIFSKEQAAGYYFHRKIA